MDRICAIFCNPPLAFARLGGSTTPLAAYRWADPSNPRSDGSTVVTPDWTLNVLPDATVDPFKPQVLRFRDGQLLRPVCPFIEIWARVGDPSKAPATWRDEPLTLSLLQSEGLAEKDLSFALSARNRKVERRTGNADLAYGTFPDLAVPGDDHQVHPILGSSPPAAANPMIPAGRHIPLGTLQVLKCRPQPAHGTTPWDAAVNVETVRLRFTPAAGLMYGPPAAIAAGVQNGPAVEAAQAFLNPAAGWLGSDGDGATGGGLVIPGDTFDTASEADTASLGVVDDTCEARLLVSLKRPALPSLVAHANIFSGPPDFAPDRRPIVSIADELNDRAGDWEERNAALSPDDLEAWVADLFERVYETVSVLNVDFWRAVNARFQLQAAKLGPAIPGDGLPQPTRPMGSRDRLRNQELTVGTADALTPLPLTEHARDRHRDLAAIVALRALVLAAPERLKTLVRGPFEAESLGGSRSEQLRQTTMRMPPFMAQSTPGTPLTLTAWQYDLLMKWVDAQQAAPEALAGEPPLSAEALKRRNDVLTRLDQAGPPR